ncbi:Fc.00g025030.m01.CDS01 [Cosmosporella sp. VM-42]
MAVSYAGHDTFDATKRSPNASTCEGYNNPICFRDQTKAIVQKAQSQAAKRRRASHQLAKPSPPSIVPSPASPTEAAPSCVFSPSGVSNQEALFEEPQLFDESNFFSLQPNPPAQVDTVTLDFMLPKTSEEDWVSAWQQWDLSSTGLEERDTSEITILASKSFFTSHEVSNEIDLSPSTEPDNNETIDFETEALNLLLNPVPSPTLSAYGHPAFDSFQFSPDTEYYRYICNGSTKGFKTIMPIVDLISDDRLASSHLYSAALAISALSVSALESSSTDSRDGISSSSLPGPLARRHALRHYSTALTSLYREFPRSDRDSFREASMEQLLGWLMTRLLLSNLDLRLGALGAWRAHLRAAGRIISAWHSRISQSAQGRVLIHTFARMALLLEIENEDFAVTKQSTMNPCVAAEFSSMIEHSSSPRDRLLALIRKVSRVEIKYRLQPDQDRKWISKMQNIENKLLEWHKWLPPSELPVDTGIAGPIPNCSDQQSSPVWLTPLTFPNSSDPYTAAVSYAHFLCARMRSRTLYGPNAELLAPSDAESSILHICRIAAGLDPSGYKQADAYGHGMMPAIVGAYQWSNDERVRSWIIGWLKGYGDFGAREGLWDVDRTRRLMLWIDKNHKGVAYKEWHLTIARIVEEEGEEVAGDEGLVWDKMAKRAGVSIDESIETDEKSERHKPFRVVMYTRSKAGPATQYFTVP